MSRKRKTNHRTYTDGKRDSFLRRYALSVSVTFAVLFAGAFILSLSFPWEGFSSDAEEQSSYVSVPPKRVISLAPSITELIYTLGVDSTLIADTRYCKHPPQADTLPDVGGFLDPNLELIVSLNPDLVILLKEYDELSGKLRKLNIPVFTVDHQTIKGVLASYTQLGARLGAIAKSDSLLAAHQSHIAKVQKLTSTLNRPKTLVSIGHSDKPGVIRSVYAAGDEGFYSELVSIAGGKNVVEDDNVRYPILGPEALRTLAPEIILDIFPDSQSGSTLDKRFVKEQWNSLSGIPAVHNSRVVVLEGSFLVIPGPRFIEILDKFVVALHPEINVSLLTR